MSRIPKFAQIKSALSRLGGRAEGRAPRTQAETVHFFANRGPSFEPALSIDPTHTQTAQARTVAFYLPQFHRFAENDVWWGDGFTEWRNVARGLPRYRGHYQPRIPADLGHYDLSQVDVIRKQSELAARNGIEAFCFYYYWFNGKRLLEKPLDLFAEHEMPVDFCLMWANENWTRTWDGLDNEVLIQQDYREEDEEAFLQDTARYMANPKYLHVDGRPLFIIYRAGLLPDAKATLARWRTRWEEIVGKPPWILMAQSFDETDPRPYGLDGAVEFPPHKICKGLGNLRKRLPLLDKNFSGLVRDYEAVITQSLSLPVPDYPEIKTVSPSWDNDARRQSRATSWMGATPALYEQWLSGAVAHAQAHPFAGEPLVFINAWNEWAEGAYLEPDVHYGHAVLNATKRAVYGLKSFKAGQPVLLLGHDAHRHGSQFLLLHLARVLTQHFQVSVHIVLKSGGELVRDYQTVARTTILDTENLVEHLARLGIGLHEYQAVIANTTVTGDLLPAVKHAQIPSVSLIHELPTLIREYGLEEHVHHVAKNADHVVFPATMVKYGFESFGTSVSGRSHIQPQGTYLSIDYSDAARQRLRQALGLNQDQRLIINVGYADHRKGFDLFLKTAEQAMQLHPNWHFAWVGKLHSDMRACVSASSLDDATNKRFHLLGFVAGNTDHFSAADAFLLTSREDPYPTVVLEALEAGLPFVGYRACSGLTELADRFGQMVDRGDVHASISALERLMAEDTLSSKQARTDYVRTQCQLPHYCDFLLSVLGIGHADAAKPIVKTQTATKQTLAS